MALLTTLEYRDSGVHNDLKTQGSPVLHEEIRTYSFTTTGTTVEVPTNLTSVDNIVAIPNAASAAGEQIGSDGVITSSAITFTRQTGTTSGLTFYYRIIGRK